MEPPLDLQLPTPPPQPDRRRRLAAVLLVVVMALGAVTGYSIVRSLRSGSTTASTNSVAASTPTTNASTATKLTLAQIEAAVDPALVDITTTLGSSGSAAGTGMVISSTGEILTNNHVVSGATSIRVQIGGTGKTYTAIVVGYDVTDDIAVLQIPNVSGLATITTASASGVTTDDAVVALGNALGKGRAPVAAAGVVTATGQTITASDESGGAQETLKGLIEFAAAVEPGDSGGATVDAYGHVVGMTTAAASSAYRPMSATSTSSTTTAYAIPIDTALSIARQIEAGTESATVHIGEHGLLGVEVQSTLAFGGDTGTGAAVVGVQDGSAAAAAGITTGDTIVAVNGTNIGSTTDLNDAMATTHVGDKITVGYVDNAGQSHNATVTLTTGAA